VQYERYGCAANTGRRKGAVRLRRDRDLADTLTDFKELSLLGPAAHETRRQTPAHSHYDRY
jgi:hypothetical protein